MAFINQEPRYSPTDGDRGFVFSTIPALPRGNAPGMGRDMGRDRAVVPEMAPVRTMVPALRGIGAGNNSEGALPNSEIYPHKDK